MNIDVSQDKNQLMLVGSIDFNSVIDWRETVSKILETKAYPQFCINFSQIVHADSTVLTLMMCWLRLAKSLGITVKYQHLSDNIISISKLYGVWSMLPLDESARSLQ